MNRGESRRRYQKNVTEECNPKSPENNVYPYKDKYIVSKERGLSPRRSVRSESTKKATEQESSFRALHTEQGHQNLGKEMLRGIVQQRRVQRKQSYDSRNTHNFESKVWF